MINANHWSTAPPGACYSRSAFRPYPINKPFVNSEWMNPNPSLSRGFPESKRDLIINSLKNLQIKLNKLESFSHNNYTSSNSKTDTRVQNEPSPPSSSVKTHQYNYNQPLSTPDRPVESNLYTAYPINMSHKQPGHFQTLHEESEFFNDGLKSEHREHHLNNIELLSQKSVNTEKRVIELEKQLERMQSLLKDVAANETASIPPPVSTPAMPQHQPSSNYPIEQVQPIEDNENYVIDFNSQMELSTMINEDNNIVEIDNQMYYKDSDGFHLPVTDKELTRKGSKKKKRQTAEQQLESLAAKSAYLNMLMSSRSKSADVAHKPKVKQPPVQPVQASQNHYRLNWGDIPFVVGQSTAPSHRVGSNIQNVISMLKMHHPKLCGSVNSSTSAAKNSNKLSNSMAAIPKPPLKSKLSRSLTNQTSCNNSVILSQNTSFNNVLATAAPTLKRNNSLRLSQSRTTQANIPPGATPLALSNSNIETIKDTFTQTSCNFVQYIECKDNEESITTKQASNNTQAECNDLLNSLQEEYTSLVLQHYDLTKKIVNTADVVLRREYEMEADLVHKKMKIKIKQINRLKEGETAKSSKHTSEPLIERKPVQQPQRPIQQPEIHHLLQQKLQQHKLIQMQLQQQQQAQQRQQQYIHQMQPQIQQVQQCQPQYKQQNQRKNVANYEDTLTESHFMSSFLFSKPEPVNNNNNNALFSPTNSANTSYMTLNDNLYKSATNYTNLNLNNKSLKFFKSIKNLQAKIQKDEFVF